MNARGWLAETSTRRMAASIALLITLGAAIGLGPVPRASMDNPAPRAEIGHTTEDLQAAWPTPIAPTLPDAADRDGDCEPQWASDLFCLQGLDGTVHAAVSWDDGTGESLYVGGTFTIAGCANTANIARWDGSAWSPLGSGVIGGPFAFQVVRALLVFDDGGGPALYAGGEFTTAGGQAVNFVARWDGSAWSPLGAGVAGGTVWALTVFDDGNGPALYVAGGFTQASGSPASGIARWDGVAWSPLGSGMNNAVTALTVYDDGGGSGPALYAGGFFTTAGGQSANRIARWDGSDWSPLGSGMNREVWALTVFDDGAGPALYAGGFFTTAGGQAANCIARWDGAAWSPLDAGASRRVLALTVFDDGSGPALYAGGEFTTAGGQAASHVARWDGAAWSPLGVGMNDAVWALTVFDGGGGSGPALYAGGSFTAAGGQSANRIALWDGSEWSRLGSGMNREVWALTVFDDGAGPALYAGGLFTTAGGQAANRIARWDGAAWSPLGEGVNGAVWSLTVFDDGAGPALYVGGSFTTAGGQAANHIARWDGAAWSPLGSGTSNVVSAMTVFDDGGGPALYAGGGFSTAGGQAANRIARWDGSAWLPLGSGIIGDTVRALTVFDDGGGPALYAGGGFTTAGGQESNHVARWDGSAWSPLGLGMNGALPEEVSVYALTVFDEGSGPALYAGGFFTTAGGQAANNIARWDGSTWSPLASGINIAIVDLTVFDDGGGPALYAGGLFSTAGGQAANNIARWDGSDWSPLGSGLSGGIEVVHALTVFDDANGPSLYAGGEFTAAGGSVSAFIAKWQGCPTAPTCPPDLNADNLLNLFDLAAFLNLFHAQDPTADWNNDTLFNFFDLASYLNAFNTGCP